MDAVLNLNGKMDANSTNGIVWEKGTKISAKIHVKAFFY